MDQEMARAFEAQLQQMVEKYHPKVAETMLAIQEQMKVDNVPVALRGVTMSTILMDMQAKYHASIIGTYQAEPADIAKKAGEALEKAINLYYQRMIQDLGKHNVHGDAVGEKLPPEQPNN